MIAEADVRGFKRICTACSARFYDMNKRPIICPSCGEEFTGEVKIRTRKAKSAIVKDDAVNAIKAKSMEDDAESYEDDAEDDEAQIVSLDDEAEIESSSDDDEDDTPAPDLDLDAGIDELDDVDIDEVDEDLDLDDEEDKD